jgi:predicted nucleic acid-binding protein
MTFMHDKVEALLREYKSDICEEVRALLDRMDKFPEEFIEDRLNNKWYKVRQALDSGEDESPFTVGEYRALHNKLAELKRNELRQSILKTIVHAAEDYDLTYDDKNRKAAINALRLPTTASTLSLGKVTLNSTELAMIKKLAKEKNNQ